MNQDKIGDPEPEPNLFSGCDGISPFEHWNHAHGLLGGSSHLVSSYYPPHLYAKKRPFGREYPQELGTYDHHGY